MSHLPLDAALAGARATATPSTGSNTVLANATAVTPRRGTNGIQLNQNLHSGLREWNARNGGDARLTETPNGWRLEGSRLPTPAEIDSFSQGGGSLGWGFNAQRRGNGLDLEYEQRGIEPAPEWRRFQPPTLKPDPRF